MNIQMRKSKICTSIKFKPSNSDLSHLFYYLCAQGESNKRTKEVH